MVFAVITGTADIIIIIFCKFKLKVISAAAIYTLLFMTMTFMEQNSHLKNFPKNNKKQQETNWTKMEKWRKVKKNPKKNGTSNKNLTENQWKGG